LSGRGILLWATEDCGIQLKDDLKTQIALWFAADQRAGVPELHRRQLLLRSGSLDNPEPTALSALVVHGLHDSPTGMTDLAEVVANHSVNTFVSRLRGHFETDRSVLNRTVRWDEWLADAEADLALAQKLGGKVVLMGHSNSRDSRPYTHASEQLKDVSVWIVNTGADIVIQKQEARAFMGALNRKSFSAVRKELWLPYSRVVRHDAIIMPSNPDLPLIQDSLREFLGQIH
jgi:hypothetical protein